MHAGGKQQSRVFFQMRVVFTVLLREVDTQIYKRMVGVDAPPTPERCQNTSVFFSLTCTFISFQNSQGVKGDPFSGEFTATIQTVELFFCSMIFTCTTFGERNFCNRLLLQVQPIRSRKPWWQPSGMRGLRTRSTRGAKTSCSPRARHTARGSTWGSRSSIPSTPCTSWG